MYIPVSNTVLIFNCFRKGDLDVMMKKFGSLHQYLLHLHDNGKSPVISFWWGKTHVVSFCSPQAFKESAVLVNRPGNLLHQFTINVYVL